MRQEWDEDGVNYQLDFFYDTQGKPLAVIYRQNGDGLSYYYLTNQQGDVTKLYKPVAVSGSTKVNMVEIATYSYDPWGKATVTVNTGSQITNNDRTLANINPLRYRGYYQDVETGFYYLQSRYYDPVIGRFINADLPEYAALSATDITGTNLFAYCKNDPINHADEDGEWLNLVIGAVVGGVISGVMAGISSYKATGKVDWGSVAINAASGAASGLVAATGLGPLVQGGISAAISGVTSVAEQWHSKGFNSIDMGEVCKDVGSSIICDGISAGVSNYLLKNVKSKVKVTCNRLADKADAKVSKYLGRKAAGRSYSSYKRQAGKLVSQRKKILNNYHGLSSVTGSFVGGVISYSRYRFKERRMS